MKVFLLTSFLLVKKFTAESINLFLKLYLEAYLSNKQTLVMCDGRWCKHLEMYKVCKVIL